MKGRAIPVEKDSFAMLLRFLLVGSGFSLSYALLNAGLVSVGAPPFWTALLLYAAAIPLAYSAQRQFAFRAETPRSGAFLVYLATQLGSFALVAGITTRFVSQVFWADMALFLVTAAAAAVLSFAVNKTFAFDRTD